MNEVKPVIVNNVVRCENLNVTKTEELRSLIDKLDWLSNQTRLDISYDVLELSCSMKHPKVEHLMNANKCVRKLNNEECDLHFPALGDLKKCKIVAYSDASHAILPDGSSSAGGHVIFLVGENGRACVLSWESKKIRRVVNSSLAAEALAASEAVDASYYLGQILSDILYKWSLQNKFPIVRNVHNKSLYDNVHSTKSVTDKRLRIDLAMIKQMIQR